MLEPTRRFDRTASDYHRHRPGYPRALFDWILAEAGCAPGAWVADLACGTGIVARELWARGLRVVGVDPSLEMLRAAESRGGPLYVRATAERSALCSGRFALCTAGQAFHWFDCEQALDEIAFLLAPGGVAAAFWNVRADGPFERAYEQLLRASSREYGFTPGARDGLARLRESPRVVSRREADFPNAQRLDWPGLRGRAWSSSYVAHGVADAPAFDAALQELFATHAHAGEVELRYCTTAVVFTVVPRG